MQNLKIYLTTIDGGRFDFESNTGQEFIKLLFGADFGAPPEALVIEAMSADGLPVRITIPNSDADVATVNIVQ